MQVSILIVQGVIVTILALTYFVMADVSVAFFLLSAVTITLYLIMYMLMYAAAIRLRYSQPGLKRRYRVPGGIVGIWCVAGVGFAGVAFAFLVGFFHRHSFRWEVPRFMSGWWWPEPWCLPGCRC